MKELLVLGVLAVVAVKGALATGEFSRNKDVEDIS